MHELQPITRQLVFRLVGKLGVMHSKVFYWHIATQLLMAEIGADDELKRRMAKAETLLQNINIYYDVLDDELVSKGDKTNQRYLRYKNELAELKPSVQLMVCKTMLDLARETNIAEKNIIAEAFMKQGRKFQKTDYQEQFKKQQEVAKTTHAED